MYIGEKDAQNALHYIEKGMQKVIYAFAQLNLVCHLCLSQKISDLAIGTYPLATSWLEYCNLLYVQLCLKMIQLVENATARLLSEANYREHILSLRYICTGYQSISLPNAKCLLLPIKHYTTWVQAT